MIKRLIGTKTAWLGLIWIAKGIVTGVFDGDWDAAMRDIGVGLALIAGRDALRKLEG